MALVQKINRKVLLIKGYSETIEEEQIDCEYIQKCKDYFCSNVGGAYDEDEITILNEQPLSSDTLKTAFQTIVGDFAIIVYIGHGATQENQQLFKLNENEIINPGEFILNIDKQLIILESCRNILEKIKVVNVFNKIPKFKPGGIVKAPLSKEKIRRLYDRQIRRCSNGVVVCCACSSGEAAYNYLFINSLIEIATLWHNNINLQQNVLPITTLMKMVTQEFDIQEENAQHPEIVLGLEPFPFAISRY